jgi:phage tail-like protein
MKNDPILNSNFLVEIDGMTRAGFAEVSFFDASKDWIEYRKDADQICSPMLEGIKRIGMMTLKTGVTDSKDLCQWYNECNNTSSPHMENKKNVDIVIFDSTGEEVARFRIAGAWPIKYAVGPLDAKKGDVLYESLDVIFERMERV